MNIDCNKKDFSSLVKRNFRILSKKYHPDLDVGSILAYSGITTYELDDQAHWFSQRQVDRFNEILVEKTDNPILRIIMEIIQRDSQMHYRIQELIADSLETKTLSLTPEELGDVWDLVEKHIQLEKKTVEMAIESLEELKGRKMVVQEYLLDYLRIDEEKHNKVLETLSTIKKGMYPYG